MASFEHLPDHLASDILFKAGIWKSKDFFIGSSHVCKSWKYYWELNDQDKRFDTIAEKAVHNHIETRVS